MSSKSLTNAEINLINWDEDDLEETLLGFREIQGEINYQQARDSLQNFLADLDLTTRERTGLEGEIERLTGLLDKLDRVRVQIAVFGLVGRGKSSVLNALLGEDAFAVGPLHGVTRSIASSSWSFEDSPLLKRVTIPGGGFGEIQLIDTPGIDEVDGLTRERLAKEVAKQADLILFVIAGDISRVEYRALCQLREAGKPIILVFNKVDRYPEADRQAIYETLRDRRVRQLISPSEIVMVAASPLIAKKVTGEDGAIGVVRGKGKPQIESLKLKILEILHREGKSLLALNTMLYTDEVNEQIVRRKMAIREAEAGRIIGRGVMIKAAAIALNPMTALDLLTGAIIDVALILSLSHLYGINLTQQGAINLLQKIALSMGGLTASELLGTLGLSGLKGLLGLATPATGGLTFAPYLSVALTQGGIAGVSTYAIAMATKTYLANGASWGPDGPKATITQILASLDEESILHRIKEELRAKLIPRNN